MVILGDPEAAAAVAATGEDQQLADVSGTRVQRFRGTGLQSMPTPPAGLVTSDSSMPEEAGTYVEAGTVAPPAPAVTTEPGITAQSNPGQCTPTCSWECVEPKCDQVCNPVCDPPKCQTRCGPGVNFTSCGFKCDTPSCSIVCPKTDCPNADGCAKCHSFCSDPVCKLQCPGTQPCRSICEEPTCRWQCGPPPACPKPQCQMKCDPPKACTVVPPTQGLPVMEKGEVSVHDFTISSDKVMVKLMGIDGKVKNTKVPTSMFRFL